MSFCETAPIAIRARNRNIANFVPENDYSESLLLVLQRGGAEPLAVNAGAYHGASFVRHCHPRQQNRRSHACFRLRFHMPCILPRNRCQCGAVDEKHRLHASKGEAESFPLVTKELRAPNDADGRIDLSYDTSFSSSKQDWSNNILVRRTVTMKQVFPCIR